jgi:hypothetical protein
MINHSDLLLKIININLFIYFIVKNMIGMAHYGKIEYWEERYSK